MKLKVIMPYAGFKILLVASLIGVIATNIAATKPRVVSNINVVEHIQSSNAITIAAKSKNKKANSKKKNKSLTTRENIVEAAKDYKRRDAKALQAHLKFEKDPRAKELISYWQAISELFRLSVTEVNNKITGFKDPHLSLLLIRAWIVEASLRKKWSEVIRWSNNLAKPNINHRCALALANMNSQSPLASELFMEEGLQVWRSFDKPISSRNGPCRYLQDRLFSSNKLTKLEKSRQIRRLLFTNSKTELNGNSSRGNTFKGLFSLHPMPLPKGFAYSNFFNKASSLEKKAQRIIKPWSEKNSESAQKYQEWMVATLITLAGKDVVRANLLYNRLEKWLSPAAAATASTYIAVKFGRNNSTQTKKWLKNVQMSELWSFQQETILRSVLRLERWDDLLTRIDESHAKVKTNITWRYWWARSLLGNSNSIASSDIESALAADISLVDMKTTPLPFVAQTMDELSLRHDFYGALASEWLGKPIFVPPITRLSSKEEIKVADKNSCLRWASLLIKQGAYVRSVGVRKWRDCVKHMNDRELLAASVVAASRGILDRSVNTAILTKNTHNWQLRFITPFAKIVKYYADLRGLSWEWVYGLMRQESRFLIDAKSSSGAKGLMQIMPKTGRWLAKKQGISGYKTEQLNGTELNVQLGTLYLQQLFERFGHPLLVTAAYNAGPSRAQRWRPDKGSLEAAIYAETIPFNETRGYVKNVLWNATIYQIIDGNINAKITDWLSPVRAEVVLVKDLP